MHPVLSLLLRARYISEAVKSGKTRRQAREAADNLDDEVFAAALKDQGVAIPTAPPDGGWLKWILDNLPAILEAILKLLALFP